MKKFNAFNKWLGNLPHPHKVVIAGNHDITLDEEYSTRKGLNNHISDIQGLFSNAIYLQDSEVTILGLRIYGSPWQPFFCDWAFNVDRGDPIKVYWDKIPEGIDILVTHGPPLGHGGYVSPQNDVGCEELIKVIDRVKPPVSIFGHIHEGYGVTRNEHTYFINGSSVNYFYKPLNSPIVFDIM